MVIPIILLYYPHACWLSPIKFPLNHHKIPGDGSAMRRAVRLFFQGPEVAPDGLPKGAWCLPQ
jgi:hypothetical protein